MIGLICRRELQDHLKSLRFQVSLAVVVLLFGLSGVIYVYKKQQVIRDSTMIEVSENRCFEEIEQVSGALRWYDVIGSRLESEFITEGGANWFEDSISLPVGTDYLSVSSGHVRAQNNFLRHYDTAADPETVARFVQRDLSLREALAAGRLPLLLLVIETLAAFGIALWSVGRMEVAG